MKNLISFILIMVLFGLSCTTVPEFTKKDKQLVEKEVLQFMDSLIVSFESISPENTFKYFLQTDELAIATKGYLITSPSAVLDTMKVHMAIMQKQVNKPIQDKVFVINKDAAVISTSKVTTITFKSGAEITVPYALTILLVKRDGGWKIAHYHN